MFDSSCRVDIQVCHQAAAPGVAAPPYLGPERRGATAGGRHWLAAMLDEVDYGMLLLSDEALALHANHAARAELARAHPLQLLARRLYARDPKDMPALADALHGAARRGLRKLLTLGEGAQRVSVSIVPLTPAADGDGPVTLVMLGKRQFCGALTVQGFAQCHGLTAAETRVLALLCRGSAPTAIASSLGVKIATVRSQIGAIRQKTGATSIRALVQQVERLPPLMSVLRGVDGQAAPGHDDGGLTLA